MNRKAIIFALVVSLVLTVAMWKWMQNAQPKPEVPVFVPPPKIPMVKAVIAKRRLGARVRLDPETIAASFEVKELVADAVPPDVFADVASFAGRYTAVTIIPGDMIGPDRLLASAAVPALSFAIPAGRRAVTIAVSRVTGVAGFIEQGDYVDVIATFKPSGGDTITKVVLQDIPILAIGKVYEFEGVAAATAPALAANNAELITMAVTPEELERLTLLDTGYTFRLVLKNPKERGSQISTKGTTEKMLMSAMGIGPQFAEVPLASPTVSFAPPAVSLPAHMEAAPGDLSPTEMQTTESGKVEIWYGTEMKSMSKYGAQNVPDSSPAPATKKGLAPAKPAQSIDPCGEAH
ncbi:MAG: Flp pilus assembly protein CpaB [Candidatus Ozemobacteraceae bacterium]